MKKRENVCKKVMKWAVAEEKKKWPPTCMGILYQPERPQAEQKSLGNMRRS